MLRESIKQLGRLLGRRNRTLSGVNLIDQGAAFDAFISYSHAADGRLAAALQKGLHRFAKPILKLRAIRVFRDETTLAMTPQLWPTIEKALRDSRFFILMADPLSAQSEWVQKEVACWFQIRHAEKMLIVWTGGDLVWNKTTKDFDWEQTTALPKSLAGAFAGEEPLYIDLRWARTEADLSSKHPQFASALARLSATIRGRPLDEIFGDDVHQHQITKGVAYSVCIALAILAGAAGWGWWRALQALRQSYLTQATALRGSENPGRQFKSLRAVVEAAKIPTIGPATELRNEAIADVAVIDIDPLISPKPWKGYPPIGLAFDSKLERYARSDDLGNISVRRVTDDHELVLLAGPEKNPAWVIRFSPNGHFLAAKYHQSGAADPNPLYIWDLGRGEVALKPKAGVCGGAFDFSPDSRFLVVGQCDGSIHLFDLALGQDRTLTRGGAPVLSLAFRPPNSQQVAFSSNNALQVLDVNSGKVVKTFSPPEPGGVGSITWSSDGNFLAAACADKRIYVWDLADADQPRAVLSGHQTMATQIAFSHGSDLLASTGWDETIRLWDPLSGRQLVRAPGRQPVQFNVDGGLLAFGFGDSQPGLWKVAIPREYCALHSYRSKSWSADFSPDGRLLASAHSDGVRLWDLSTLKEIDHLNQRQNGDLLGYTRSVIFHPNGKSLITCGPGDDRPRTAGVDVWPIATDPRLAGGVRIGPQRRVDLPEGTVPLWATLCIDGRTLVIADSSHGGQIIVLDLEDSTRKTLLPADPAIDFVTADSRGRWVAFGTWGSGFFGRLRQDRIRVSGIPDVRTGQDLESNSNSLFVAFSPNGKWLVTSSGEEYHFWEVGSWKGPVHRIRKDYPESLGSPVAFAPDGKMLAIARSPREVELLDPASGWAEIATLQAPDPKMLTWLRFSPDASKLVATSDDVIQLWDLRLIRKRLAPMKLNWNLPPYPQAGLDRQ
jgi:WD40 repeat protein